MIEMKYLVPEPRKRRHSVMSHILADDGVTALCAYVPNRNTWPRVKWDDWKIADDAAEGMICSRCVQKKRKMETPQVPKPAKMSRRAKRELYRLEQWNARARRTQIELDAAK